MVWAQPPVPGVAVAAVSDNDQLDEATLRNGLSANECDTAAAIADPAEKRHYMLRRCFQRAFVGAVLDRRAPFNTIDIEHRLDSQPKCLQAPDLKLSFSASGFTAVACASLTREVGIDIERVRDIENLKALARRFFTEVEADIITALPRKDQNLSFLRTWTAKEAGLKALGRGIVSGLNSLILTGDKSTYHPDIIDEFKMTTPWQHTHLAFIPQHIVTVVHSPEK